MRVHNCLLWAAVLAIWEPPHAGVAQRIDFGVLVRQSIDDVGVGWEFGNAYDAKGLSVSVESGALSLGAHVEHVILGVSCLAIEDCEDASGEAIGPSIAAIPVRLRRFGRTMFDVRAEAAAFRLIRTGTDKWIIPFGIRGDLHPLNWLRLSAGVGRVTPPFVGARWYVQLGAGAQISR